ncbi:hypothetical protein BGZ76_006226, partial [Entomortierella beljakovae]
MVKDTAIEENKPKNTSRRRGRPPNNSEITPFVGTFSAMEKILALKRPKHSRVEVVIPSIPRGRSINPDTLPLSAPDDSDSDVASSSDSDYSDSERRATGAEAPQPQVTNRPANVLMRVKREPLEVLMKVLVGEVHQIDECSPNLEQQENNAFSEAITTSGTNMANTKNQYKTYLSLFKFPYDVQEEKAFLFFQKVIFNRKTTKCFYIERDLKPLRCALFRLEEVPDYVSYLNGISGQALAKVFFDKDAPYDTPLDLLQILKSRPQSEYSQGRVRLTVPCGPASIEQARKALVHLQAQQSKRLNSPNKVESVRKSQVIDDSFKKYKLELVYGEIKTG